MKKIFLTILVVYFVNPSFSQKSVSDLVGANNQFALELFSSLKKTQTNCLVSPFSISTALAMTYAGAKNQTDTAMHKVLHFNENNEYFHNQFENLINKVESNKSSEFYKLNLANKIWVQKNTKLTELFLKTTKTSYNAPAEQVSFLTKKDLDASRKKINNWVEDQTNKKIKDLIKEGILTTQTQMVLTNAIYFFSSWESAFNTENTVENSFFVNSNLTEQVKFMNKTIKTKYFEDTQMQAVKIQYSMNNAAFVLILPSENTDLERFESTFNYTMYSKMMDSFSDYEVSISMPRFKMQSEFELSETLKSMGMADAFSNQADFSGMTGTKELKIDKIIHKTFIELNEKGTEAAAATAVIMVRKGGTINQLEQKKLLANRPFFFIITDNATGSIIFMGKLFNPKI